MKTSRPIAIALLCAWMLSGFVSPAFAQFSKLADLADRFSRDFKRANAKVVVVEDFTAPDARRSEQGEYFSSFVATIIKSHNGKMTVATRQKGKSVVTGNTNTETDTLSADAKAKESEQIVPEYLVTGTVETTSNTYTVHVMARRAQDNSLLVEKSAVMPRTEFTDSLSEVFPPQTDYPAVRTTGWKNAMGGPHIPECIYCPYPNYNDRARAAHLQGTCLFEALISAEGRAVKIHLLRQLGYGLDEQAFNAMKFWIFKPASDDQGNPIPVIVPIEVTFRLR